MNNGLSLSVFTIEVDSKPVVTFACRKHAEAEQICAYQRIRANLCSLRSGGNPLCDELAILRVRLASPDEKALYRERASTRSAETGLLAAYLVELEDAG